MSTTARPVAPRSVARQSRRLTLAEGAIVLIILYGLLGAGIGSACGSVVLGMVFGLVVGVFAISAILLISGSAQEAEIRVDARGRQVQAGTQL